MKFILNTITSYHLAASTTLIVSLYVAGSLTSIKKRLREYLSSGYASPFDRYGMTRLAGLGIVVLHTSKLGSTLLVGSIVAVLLGFCESTSLSVLELGGLADRETILLCCARPSKGVGTSANVTLHSSIGCSTTLCITDLLKTVLNFGRFNESPGSHN
jgi:hypothetical protein